MDKKTQLLKKKQEQAKLLKSLPIEEVIDHLSDFIPKQRQGILHKTYFPVKEFRPTQMPTTQIWSIPHNTIISIANLMHERYPTILFKKYFPTDYDPAKDINFLHRMTLLPGSILNPPCKQSKVKEKKILILWNIFFN